MSVGGGVKYLLGWLFCPAHELGIKSRKRPWIAHLLCFVMAAGNIPLGILMYWIFIDPLYPVMSIDSNIELESDKSGRIITATMHVNKLRPCPGTIQQRLMNNVGDIYLLPALATNLPVGNHHVEHLRILPDLPPGDYVYSSEIHYHCNPVKDIIVKLPDVKIHKEEKSSRFFGDGIKATTCTTDKPSGNPFLFNDHEG